VAYCGPCAERRNTWHKGQLNRGVAGDGDREKYVLSFYQAAETSVKPGSKEPTVFQRFVRVPNPKSPDKQHKRAGRWRAGADGVRKPQGPRPWRPFVWVSTPHEFADCIQADGDKPCRDCTEYALESVGAPAAARATPTRDTEVSGS